MRHEVRTIPPAPRAVRWRPLFAHRWLLFAGGGGMVVTGGLLAWLMFLQSGGKMSAGPAIERGPVERVVGALTRVDPPRTWNGGSWQAVTYRFVHELDGQHATGYGGCFVPAGDWHEHELVDVDVLTSDPNVSCIAGGVLHGEFEWLRARFWITVMAVPGGLLLLSWLAGVFQLRHVLVHGDVSIGLVHRVVRVPWVLPEMVRVDYTFRDHRAVTRHNHHWVRAHGALGARLLQQANANAFEEMPVLHDRRLPQWNRMLLPQDFLPQPPALLLDIDLPTRTRT
jgi:hypothetical protein